MNTDAFKTELEEIEIARFDADIAALKRASDQPSREKLAGVMLAKGDYLAELARTADATRAFDALAAQFGDGEAAPVREKVADAIFYKSQNLFDLGEPDQALDTITKLLQRFGADTDIAVRRSVCHALFVTTFTLRDEDPARDEALIAICDEAISRFGSDEDYRLRERLLHIRIAKSFALKKLHRRAEGVALRNDVVRRYATTPEVELREHADRVVAAMDERFDITDGEKDRQ